MVPGSSGLGATPLNAAPCECDDATDGFLKFLKLGMNHGLHSQFFWELFRICSLCEHVVLADDVEEHVCKQH